MTRPTLVLSFLGAATIALNVAAGLLFNAYGNPAFGLVMVIAGIVAFPAMAAARGVPPRTALAIIIGVAVCVRVVAFVQRPLLSTDIYRYVWDGRVQAAGVNPYRYVPADPALAPLRDPTIYPMINRADYAHTAYPPVAQAFFLLATRLADSINAIKLALIAGEIVTLLAILRLLKRFGRARSDMVGYLWHPLAIWEIANAGHIDALICTLTVTALLALVEGRRLLGVALAACGVLVKPYMLALMPAFWRPWDWRAPLLVILIIAALYAPYLSVGAAVIGFVPGYVQEEGFAGGSGFWLVSLARFLFGDVPGFFTGYVLLGAAVLAWLTYRLVRKPASYDPRLQYRDAMVLLAAGIVVLSPNYAWYYVPLVPFVALGGGIVAWTMTVSAVLLHVSWPFPINADLRFLWWKSVMSGALLLSLALAAVRERRSRMSARGVTGEGTPP